MHVVRAGSGVPPLVFVHGFACSHGDWQAQLDHFARRHRVLACDLRGHGQTPAEPDEVSIETFGMDVAKLLEDEKLSGAVLVGHSMGCRVVLQAMLKDASRIGGLVLIDGSRMGEGDPKAAAESAAAAIAALGYSAWARKFFEAMFVASSDAKLKAETVERAVKLPEAIGSALFPRMNAWDAAVMEKALRAVRVPTLVIQSTKLNAERVRVSLAPGDTSPYLELVKKLLPAATIDIVPGAGHFSQLEAAGKVNQLIEGFVES
jgi:pimeloyl-ACP methyl ester carboxylesterase